MIWAVKDSKKIRAEPSQKAICPLCFEEVISKCGLINIWHWSHKKNANCDSFGEPETIWHIDWKNHFPKENQEVVIGEHRADIKTKEGLIIELQNSPISPSEIIERENYYGDMIWILNSKTLAKNLTLYQKRYNKYEWKWFPKSWKFARKKIYIDFGEYLVTLDNLDSSGHYIKHSKEAFIIINFGRVDGKRID